MSWEAGVMMTGVGILWYLGILLVNTDDDHAAIRLFYLLISVWFMVALVNVGIQMAIANSASSIVEHSIGILYNIVVWVARIVTGYFVFYYVWYVINLIKQKIEDSKVGNIGK